MIVSKIILVEDKPTEFSCSMYYLSWLVKSLMGK